MYVGSNFSYQLLHLLLSCMVSVKLFQDDFGLSRWEKQTNFDWLNLIYVSQKMDSIIFSQFQTRKFNRKVETLTKSKQLPTCLLNSYS
jgi:hypothetical protein